ncbi:MAG: ABC transporter ATP-binding protein [Oscillospiraceae bacterium]|jgi:ABC-2 type transport system ATP-binding protein|nr:ABC transporter ATP-binding protein [Oscillospiraceae bacterium]
MSTVALRIEGLDKSFGKRKVIDNVSFETYAGEVFGFLGPNGAGKTTTIKLALGLLGRDAGRVEICGMDVDKHYEQAMAQVGGIVENPETYKYLSGWANLKQFARLHPGVDKGRIAQVVQQVGLEKRIHDKVRTYSLGMKQRLGLAAAMLHRPKLMIFDEPTNGLDPAGIRELRDTFRRLAAEEGVAVLVSSHLLSEMEQMCDRVGIIVNGKILGVKTTVELLRESSGGAQKVVRFTVNNAALALPVFAALGVPVSNVSAVTLDATIADDALVGHINVQLIQSGIAVLGIQALAHSLEDVFLQLTGTTGGDQIA